MIEMRHADLIGDREDLRHAKAHRTGDLEFRQGSITEFEHPQMIVPSPDDTAAPCDGTRGRAGAVAGRTS
jgi:hypothetical protein